MLSASFWFHVAEVMTDGPSESVHSVRFETVTYVCAFGVSINLCFEFR